LNPFLSAVFPANVIVIGPIMREPLIGLMCGSAIFERECAFALAERRFR